MRLTKIEISKYKSCDKTTLEINNHLTALIGVNGSGKTNILLAIKLLKKLFSNNVGFRKNSYNVSQECSLKATFVKNDKEILLKAVFNYDYGSRSEEEIISVVTSWRIPELTGKKWCKLPAEFLSPEFFKYLPFSLEDIYSSNTSLEVRGLISAFGLSEGISRDFIKRIQEVGEFISHIHYYSATLFSNPQKSPSAVEFEERKSGTLRRWSTHKGVHEKFIIDLITSKRDNLDGYEEYISLVGPDALNLVDGIAFEEVEFSTEEVNVKSGGKIFKDTRKKIIFVPKINIGSRILSFNQLSEGTFKTLALIFYILNQPSKLLLIEEPEVCIHHGLLKSVIEIIKQESFEKQIIISTHSDYLLDQLKIEDLTIITRDNVKGTKSNQLTKSLTSNNMKALRQYLTDAGNLGEYWKEGGFDA